jgi:hypothetical protein
MECDYGMALLVGLITGAALILSVLLLMGSSDVDPDEWR